MNSRGFFLGLAIIVLFFITCKKEEIKTQPVLIPEPLEAILPDLEGTQYATWIMIWDRSSEGWWKADNTEGATIFVNGKWQSIDWKDNNQINEYIQNLKDAGITILICDLTNGWGWLDDKVQYIQSLCAKNGMKLCIAENSSGNVSDFEAHAQDIWSKFAKASLPYGSTYLRKDGKPVIVCYSIRSWYNSYKNSLGANTKKFTLVWASGEDSNINKWGWQLEPWIASEPSTDAMFVTSAIKWSSQADSWRKSLAWLDYNFLIARQNNPKYIIVGSYDDIHERNGWLIANTTNSIHGMQMRDKTGAISNDAYFNRVKEWTGGGAISSVGGGLVKDGCYSLVNVKSSLPLQMRGGNGAAGSILEQTSSPVFLLNKYFWLYHLGDNIYRIISLPAGLSIVPTGGSVNAGVVIDQNWDQDVSSQKWKLYKNVLGEYSLQNYSSGKYLDVAGESANSGTDIIQSDKGESSSQLWKLESIVHL